ncbi:MAG: ATP-binding protein [Candidatus Methylomirabilia bacterium]
MTVVGIARLLPTLFEHRVRRARETQALLDAARAVSGSLEVGETIRVILERAQEVLGVASCGLMTLDHPTGELRSVASLDLTEEAVGRIRIKVGEGITGLAVKERRPVQSEDIYRDSRVLYPDLPKETGLRSMLSVPLLVGEQVMGALTVFRTDVHRFSDDEERLLSAFADQAAIALDHARLYSSVRTYSEQLESMVTERTRELNEQKRFVEVVLETLPLGLYVLDDRLSVVTANREGARVLPCEAGPRCAFLSLVPDVNRRRFQQFLEGLIASRKTSQVEEELELNGQSKTLRLTAAPLESAGSTTHVVLIIEDITLQKRLARRMLLTERLSTAGRLAGGVAHELNNPLATIAGCAEALRERARAPELTAVPAFQDFPSYLAMVEEETYRCKEITGSLLQFVRDPGSRRAPTDVSALVGKALDLLRHQARFSEAQFLTELDATLPSVLANEGQLRQVFLGLAANALEAMEGKGCLTVRSRRLPGDEIEVEFEDEGPGIPEEVLPRVFDAFFTTKPPGQGTGLGLAIAQGILTDHGGRIEVTSRTGQGARFRVILPLTPEGEGR